MKSLMMQNYSLLEEVTVVIEQVSSRPREGTASSFRFGYGAGLWHGIAVGLHLPVVFVTPRAWRAISG